jgi:serine phosphatase RsbU (regulator of sigma subunit)
MVELGGTLNAEEAVSRLARLVVPAIADWCIVTLLDDELPGPRWRRLRDVGWWHRDPAKRELVERYTAVRLEALTAESFLAQALQSGRPALVRAEEATSAIAAVLEPGEARKLLLQLRPGGAAAIPLRERGRTLGVLTVYHDEAGATDGPDLQTAIEVADRAGLALENARLYEEQRRLSARLQRSLLTAPPEPDHMEIVVRYEPAVEAAQVGGDWYDAFMQQHGATMIVIGDVVGHDAEAAAAMGQVRGLLRGIAATTGEGPAAVLSRLDRAMELLRIDTTATAVVARFEQTADERARGVTRLRWSNAGHPPPMAIHSDGSVTLLADLAAFDSDLLLGIDPAASRSETEIVLDRDATVLFYTDGLVERRGQSVDEGMRRLRDVLTEVADQTLDDLCDQVLERMLPAEPEDDVAMVAIRLHRQDQPRPAVAGPERVPAVVEPVAEPEVT